VKTLLRDDEFEAIRKAALAGNFNSDDIAKLLDEVENRRALMDAWTRQIRALKQRARAAENVAAQSFKAAYRKFMSESKTA